MSNLEQAFNQVVSNALKATLAYAYSEWTKEAQDNLRSSREDYMRGLQGVVMKDSLSGYIELQGKFPVMLEQGFSQYDIKDGFANSPKTKQNMYGGWYLTIPYRHYTASTFNPVMPSDIKREATKLSNGEQLKEALVRDLGYEPKVSHAGYEWKNSQYDNLTRIVKEYDSGKKHSQYVTFRRVSDKSDPNSWIHPGYKGIHAADKVATKLDKFFYDYLKD